MNRAARIAAAGIAAIAWIGLATQFVASMDSAGSAGGAIWAMLRYFTVIANLLAAFVFTGVTVGSRWAKAPALLGGVTIAMLLVGIVYATLLSGLLSLSGGARVADFLLHRVMPVAVTMWWTAYRPRGGLRWRDPVAWALLPFVYFAYALGRGAIDGRYPYPFMNVATIGWPQTAINAVVMAAGFLVAGYVLVLFDRWR